MTDFDKDLAVVVVLTVVSFFAGHLLGAAGERRSAMDRDLERLVHSAEHRAD